MTKKVKKVIPTTDNGKFNREKSIKRPTSPGKQVPKKLPKKESK